MKTCVSSTDVMMCIHLDISVYSIRACIRSPLGQSRKAGRTIFDWEPSSISNDCDDGDGAIQGGYSIPFHPFMHKGKSRGEIQAVVLPFPFGHPGWPVICSLKCIAYFVMSTFWRRVGRCFCRGGGSSSALSINYPVKCAPLYPQKNIHTGRYICGIDCVQVFRSLLLAL